MRLHGTHLSLSLRFPPPGIVEDMKSRVVHAASSARPTSGVATAPEQSETHTDAEYAASVLEAAQFVADRSRELNRRLA